jgi:hypothetical protein
VTTAPAEEVALVLSADMAGIPDAVVSATVTTKPLDPALPAASVAEQVPSLVPSGNVLQEQPATGVAPCS